VLPFKLAAAAMVVIALGFAGDGDFEDAKASERDYIERYCTGVHGNYMNLEVACGD
tara:strand:+ start:568 stop:735 length:168 start_codon:yes stop_codon:yes gene_type:complete